MPPQKKETAGKYWYWEAEQNKIASDKDLMLIRSPDGWPSEGLECVGLWFLMFNLMASSARRGYLSDPTDDRKPMSADAIAVLTGRSAAVISRIQAVILERGMFSINEDGIIYSRGLVRKEELRKKRSKSGKKGGKRTQNLLKQRLNQKLKQPIGIGIELDPLNSSSCGNFAQAKVEANFELTADGLAQTWVFELRSVRNGVKRDKPEDAAHEIAEWIRLGVSPQAIAVEFVRPDRDRTEWLSDVKKRLLPSVGKQQISDEEQVRINLERRQAKEERK